MRGAVPRVEYLRGDWEGGKRREMSIVRDVEEENHRFIKENGELSRSPTPAHFILSSINLTFPSAPRQPPSRHSPSLPSRVVIINHL